LKTEAIQKRQILGRSQKMKQCNDRTGQASRSEESATRNLYASEEWERGREGRKTTELNPKKLKKV